MLDDRGNSRRHYHHRHRRKVLFSIVPVQQLLLLLVVLFVQLISADPHLPFGDINIIVVTDVHSFVGGHPHEKDHDADYGDLLSFYQHIKEYCDKKGSDLFFFNIGDWIHGTGLAMDGNATLLVPILKQMPWDGIALGNHEAYHSAVVELMRDDMIPHFGEAFITSNTDYAETSAPFGPSRYRLLQGKNNTILTFGFLYDNHINPSQLLEVKKVQDVLDQNWFRVALQDQEYDAIVVLAHMDNDDHLIELILKKIREYVSPNMPVQFLTGHTHKRKSREIGKDHFSQAFEAGGFFDTVGFVSLPTNDTAAAVTLGELRSLFQGDFLDTSKIILKEKANVALFPTEDGIALSNKISQTRSDLGLNEVVGCPPREYFLTDRTIHEEDSLYKLWIEHIAPSQICVRQGDCAMLISSTNSFRYDIRISKKNDVMTVDDIVAIVPFMEPVMYIGEIPEWVVRKVNSSLNTDAMNHRRRLPDYLISGKFDQHTATTMFKFYTHEFDLPVIMHDLDRLMPGHTLKPKKAKTADTLYWLNYVGTAWKCPGQREEKHITPWFADIKELDEEASDGGRTGESMDELDHELDRAEKKPGSHSHHPGEGSQGYINPSSYEQYKDKLPTNFTHSIPLKPKVSIPKKSDPKKNPNKNKNHLHSTAKQKEERMKRRKKIQKRFLRVLGALIAIGFLCIPICGLYRSFFPNPQGQRNYMSDEQFYDMREMRSFKKRREEVPIREIHLV